MNYYVGNCTLSEEQKANLTNTHIYIPVSWVCSYTYMCTNTQVMVEVQYCWGIDIFSPILIFKIFSSETDKLTSHCFIWRRLAFLLPESSLEVKTEWETALPLLHSSSAQLFTLESPITYLLLDFYATQKIMTSASWSLPEGVAY